MTPWYLQRIKPSNSLKVHRSTYDLAKEIEYGSGGELIVDVVLVGDNIVIKVNESTNEIFWFMLVDKCVHVVEEDFTDA